MKLSYLSSYLKHKFHVLALVKIRGLDADARYEFNLSDDLIIKSGSYLMNHGIQVKLSGDYASTIIKFKKIA